MFFSYCGDKYNYCYHSSIKYHILTIVNNIFYLKKKKAYYKNIFFIFLLQYTKTFVLLFLKDNYCF